MKQIYFDRQQCDDFDISYFEGGKTALPADVILRSKGNGYDRKHRDFLEPIGTGLVHLSKTPDDAPGWYTVENR